MPSDLPTSSSLTAAAFLQDAVCHLSRLHAAERSSILLLEGQTLHHGAAVGLPADYVEAIDGIAIGPEVGTCGSAAHNGTSQVTTDIFEDPRWEAFRPLAEAAGLRACWSVPLVHEGTVLGTFAVYHEQPYEPSPKELELAESYAGVL